MLHKIGKDRHYKIFILDQKGYTHQYIANYHNISIETVRHSLDVHSQTRLKNINDSKGVYFGSKDSAYISEKEALKPFKCTYADLSKSEKILYDKRPETKPWHNQ